MESGATAVALPTPVSAVISTTLRVSMRSSSVSLASTLPTPSKPASALAAPPRSRAVASSVVSTGTSLVPVIVTVPPWPSSSVTVNTSVAVSPAARYWVALLATL